MSINDRCYQEARLTIARFLSLTPEEFSESENFFQLGIDSMHLMAVVGDLRKQKITINLRDLYKNPSLDGLRSLIQQNGHAHDANVTTVVESVLDDHTQQHLPTMLDGQPFAMTAVQHAYFVGRAPEQSLGGVGCHLYQEFDGSGLSAEALNIAVAQLIQRHPMLSMVFSADGHQRWLAQSCWQGVTLHDLRSCSEEEQERELLILRDKYSHRVLNVEQGQCFDIHLVMLPENRHRLLVDIDLLIMDASSFSLFFTELAACLNQRKLSEPLSHYDFRSYLVQANAYEAKDRIAAEEYWQSCLDDFPSAPNLPLCLDPEKLGVPHFSRHVTQFSSSQWQQLKTLAATHQVTPTMVLATVFSLILSRWSGQTRFALNLTLFDCLPLHKDIKQMLADFTNILLVDVDIDQPSFVDVVHALQHRFAEVYQHRSMSGVEVIRELKKCGTHPHGVPVVFTSNLGRSLYGDDIQDVLGEPGWGISQTPQVWIDFVAYEQDGELFLQWDSNNALFPEGLLDAMFGAFEDLTTQVIEQHDIWSKPSPDILPLSQRQLREQLNTSTSVVPEGLLHQRIFEFAQHNADASAVIFDEQQVSYGELINTAKCIAASLVNQGVLCGERVAISMDKGLGQIVSVLGVLYAGAVYVPVPPNQPDQRRKQIYNSADIRHVLICDEIKNNYRWPEGAHYSCWQAAKNSPPLSASIAIERQVLPDQEAYIIYTSGSTGVPKGVVISHRGALNTCIDINTRHKVTENDRVLGLSALHFDLSVYDIFGVLSAGGTLVLLKEQQLRDPLTWNNLIEKHGITLWNTVPALFDMLLTFAEGMALTAPAQLRVVMLSGDWIGLSLPERYHQLNASGVFSAMGGATEASIWSNEYIVTTVDSTWQSIPYGYPLTHQKYRIVDAAIRDCPDWVPGELWIGGVGVAMGYCNNPEQTQAQFIEDNGERWYRTGDMGCYWPDGTLEFLGRKDNQIKVGGYRIELGEIDAGIARVAGIKAGVAVAIGERDKQLVGCIVLQPSRVSDNTEDSLYKTLSPANSLPESYASLFPDVLTKNSNEEVTLPLVLRFIVNYWQQKGIDCAQLPQLSAADIVAITGVKPAYEPLYRQWLSLYKNNSAMVNNLVELSSDIHHPLQKTLASSLQLIDDVLCGRRAVEVLLDSALAPEQLLYLENDNAHYQNTVIDAIIRLSKKLQRPVNVVEWGCRSGLHAKRLLQNLDANMIAYTGVDTAMAMVTKARHQLADFVNARVEHINLYPTENMRYQADIVLLNNTLHTLPEPRQLLPNILSLAAPEAMVVVFEVTQKSPLTLLSADILSSDIRLPTYDDWATWFADSQLLVEKKSLSSNGHAMFVLRCNQSVSIPDHDALIVQLEQQMPAYMVPRRLVFMDALPLTPNGKVNRRTLLKSISDEYNPHSDPTITEPQSLTEKIVIDVWKRLLDIQTISRDSDFFQLGADSLSATRCIGALENEGYKADLSVLFATPCLHEFAATLVVLHDDEASSASQYSITADWQNRYLPFPLTDVQQAYWIGRQDSFSLGGVGSHFFIEFSVIDLDIVRFNHAWNQLIKRHDMLRMVVRDHQQCVLETVPAFATTVYVVSEFDDGTASRIRQQQSHQVLEPSQWPLFTVQALINDSHETRLLISLDNMMLDGLSMQRLFAELEALYHQPDLALPEIGINFRDYVTAYLLQREQRESEQSTARQYWRQQLSDLPSAPQLPLYQHPDNVSRPTFIRAAARLDSDKWQALKALAQQHQITASALLISSYSAILSAWSRVPELTINLTLFDRQDVHPDIQSVLGDFTSLLLVPWVPQTDWLTSAKHLQATLASALKHSNISAVWVMRELAQKQQQASATMPVVFTSALGANDGDFLSEKSLLKPIGGISQTPQVWLDHQVYESDGELRLNWDAVEELFPRAILDQMFSQYYKLLEALATQELLWHQPLENLIDKPAQIPQCVFVDTLNQQSNTDSTTNLDSSSESVALSQESTAYDSMQRRLIVAVIIKKFLKITQQTITPDKNFFDAGAHSLHLVQLHIELEKLGYGFITVTDIFAYPSPNALVDALLAKNNESQNIIPEQPVTDDTTTSRRVRRQRRRARRSTTTEPAE